MGNYYSPHHHHPLYRPIRVLLADGEPAIRDTVSTALNHEGFEVLCLTDGQAVWEILYVAETRRQIGDRSFPFQLLILDWLLPQVTGGQICQFLRARRNPVPVLLTRCRATEADKVLGLDLGADDYLAKPFGLQEFIARCRCLLRPQLYNLSRPLILSFGDIRLYPDEHRVVVRGQEVNLPLQEFRLLHLFLESPQRLWKQQDLIQHLWGTETDIHPKTLAAYINRLREKIEVNPRSPHYIRTIRGQGYCFGSIRLDE